MLKKTSEQIGATLIVLYFVFDSLQKLLDFRQQTFLLIHKSEQIETVLYNNGWLPFEFSHIPAGYGQVLTFMVGIIQLIGAVGTLWYDEFSMRLIFISLLLSCIIYDSILIHEPFSEYSREKEREALHFGSNIALAGGLIMLAGIRD